MCRKQESYNPLKRLKVVLFLKRCVVSKNPIILSFLYVIFICFACFRRVTKTLYNQYKLLLQFALQCDILLSNRFESASSTVQQGGTGGLNAVLRFE